MMSLLIVSGIHNNNTLTTRTQELLARARMQTVTCQLRVHCARGRESTL